VLLAIAPSVARRKMGSWAALIAAVTAGGFSVVCTIGLTGMARRSQAFHDLYRETGMDPQQLRMVMDVYPPGVLEGAAVVWFVAALVFLVTIRKHFVAAGRESAAPGR
jgi:hypothetical protein